MLADDACCSCASPPPRACAGSRRRGCGSTRAGCSARSAARRPPSRARRRSAAARRRPRPRAAAPGRRSRGNRRGTPSRARASQPSGARRAAQDLDGRHGVRERAQHPGDVAERRALAPALGERARRLALEVDHHPVARSSDQSVCPRWRSPCVRIVLPNEPACESSASDSRTSSPRPRIGSSASTSSGSSTKMRLISSSTVAVSSASDSVLGSSGRSRVARVGAEHGVHRAGHLRRAGAAARGTRSGSLSQLVERELPAVDGAPRTYSCSTPSVASSGRPTYAYQPASCAMFCEAALGEEAQQLELGVDAGLEPAEDLEDQLLVEDDRRVRLLARRSRARSSARVPSRRSPRARGTRARPPRPGRSRRARIMCTSSRT